MMNCGSLVKSALVAIILVVASGHPDEKLASCCTKVNKLEITEPILGYLVQQRKPPCVQAVIFQTETGLYCSQLNAPWVLRKIRELSRRAKAQTTASPMVSSSSASLLSIITSTASPPSSSTLLPSSSSSSSLSTSSSSISSTLLPSSFSSSSLSTSSSSISSTLLPSSSSSAPSLSSTLLPSSSTPSFSSASTTPADETFSGSDEE
ncbi:putative protein TPRXL isoform X1 [Kryptolebias marmoratus]|uniref:putative protein TPRXL isoform X1 n=1 Tax=Kryptolebias marmoratus TaxID=37003 RepID=UPI0018ACC154|nr:putative protein TPRXL isoform X1 [Kryptolebias marmoratus]